MICNFLLEGNHTNTSEKGIMFEVNIRSYLSIFEKKMLIAVSDNLIKYMYVVVTSHFVVIKKMVATTTLSTVYNSGVDVQFVSDR